jgi:hypothetical protein
VLVRRRFLFPISALAILLECDRGGKVAAEPGADASAESDVDKGSPDSGGVLDSSGDELSDCFTVCPGHSATLLFSCLAVVTSLQETGPCLANECTPKGDAACAQSQVIVVSTGAGACHVALILQGSFAYSADVTFAATAPSGCCPAGVAPTQSVFDVGIPTASCASPPADAGDAVDSGAVDGPPGDAPAEDDVDPGTHS